MSLDLVRNNQAASTTVTFLTGDAFPQLNTGAANSCFQDYPDHSSMVAAEFETRRKASQSLPPKQRAKALKKLAAEEANIRKGIELSAVARKSIQGSIVYRGFEGSVFTSRYEMVKNGPFNGHAINGQTVDSGITSSLYRNAPNLSLARKMTTTEGETIAYAGRPDNKTKFVELLSLVFQGEFNPATGTGDGITNTGKTDANGRPIYQLKCAMSSFLSTTEVGEAEWDLITEEVATLQALKNGGIIKLKDKDGVEHPVEIDIAFFAKQFNFMCRLERSLPSDLSGKANADKMSASSLNDLENMLTEEQQCNPQIRMLLHILRTQPMQAEEELFCRILVCKLAHIPQVFHCRSCVDRTSIAAAMAYAIDTWLKLGLPITPDNPLAVIDDEHFKEFFAANVIVAHQMTHYSREQYGFKWQTGPVPLLTLHPAICRLMPDRYLTSLYLGNKEARIPPRITALYGSLFILSNLKKTLTEWVPATDNTDNAWRPVIIALRALAVLVSPIWLVMTCLALFVVGTIGGVLSSLPFANPLHLLLGFNLIYAFFTLAPERVLKDNITVDGQPLMFKKAKREKPVLAATEPEAIELETFGVISPATA